MNSLKRVLATIIWLTVLCPLAFAETDKVDGAPANLFSIGDVHIGSATLSDVQSELGPANAYEHDKGLVRTLCYYSRSKRGFVVLEVNSSVLGGLQRLTGFVIRQARKHPERCTQSLIDVQNMRIGMGVRLGQSEREFRATLPLHFKRSGIKLSHEIEYRREMTDTEIASMRQQWPDIRKPSFFDVVELVRATVRNGVIESYEVNRTESY